MKLSNVTEFVLFAILIGGLNFLVTRFSLQFLFPTIHLYN